MKFSEFLETLFKFLGKLFEYVFFCAIIGGIIIGIEKWQHHSIEEQRNRSLPISLSSLVGRDGHLFATDDYYINILVYHNGTWPASGRYTLMASGDVRGTPNETSADDANYVFRDFSDAAPGEANGIKARFYLQNSSLKKSNLEAAEINAVLRLELKVVFTPASTETHWDPKTAIFSFSGGKWNYGPLPQEEKK